MSAAHATLDVTVIRHFYPPTALVGLGTSPYTVLVASRAVRRTKVHVTTLMQHTTTQFP